MIRVQGRSTHVRVLGEVPESDAQSPRPWNKWAVDGGIETVDGVYSKASFERASEDEDRG